MTSKELSLPPYYQSLRHFLHDLAQPLATVTGMVDLLLFELDEHDKVFQEIQLISSQLEKIITIIGEIRQLVQEASERETQAAASPQSSLF
jgi:signal transduction histidine kinase